MTDDDVDGMDAIELQKERVRIQRGQARDVRWLLVATVAHVAASTPSVIREVSHAAPTAAAFLVKWWPW